MMLLCVRVLLVLTLLPFVNANAQTTFWSTAKTVDRPANAPRYSDVVFSIRWNRERCNLSHARNFHANRIEWSYISDYEWVREVKSKGYFLGGAINPSMSDEVTPLGQQRTYAIGRIESKDGSDHGPEHLMAMGQKVGCSNSPDYRKIFIDRAVSLAEAGVDAIHVDGPSGAWGDVVAGRPVCFCNSCRKLAEKRNQDIESKTTRSLLQRYGLKRMYGDAMARTRQINPEIIWTKNVYKPQWYESMFNYEFAELDPHDGIDPASFVNLRKREDGTDRFQIYTLRSGNVLTNKQTIALAYATGSLVSAPYDVYPEDGFRTKKRFYGRYFHFSPLYAMARACGPLLDDYESAFHDVEEGGDPRWDGKPIEVVSENKDEVAVFVRAKPNQPESGLAIHLLDRSNVGTCESAKLRIRRADLSPMLADTQPPQLAWITPVDFQHETHERVVSAIDQIASTTRSRSSADCGKAFQELVRRQSLIATLVGDDWEIDIPRFSICSILHVSTPSSISINKSDP